MRTARARSRHVPARLAEPTARDILQRNEWIFEERKRALSEQAAVDPYRHPPEKRTWWDWEEIARRERESFDEVADARAGAELHKALRLAPTLEVCEALLRGESVPKSRLDPEWSKAYGL